MKFTFNKSSTLILTLLALLFSAIGVSPAYAAGIVVNSLLDTAVAGDGNCTLREAINNANADGDTSGGDCFAGSGVDTITFSLGGTISLGSPLPEIAGSTGLAIDGSGHRLTIDGNHAVQILVVGAGNSLTLNSLTIANGNSAASGGGISNDGGTLTVTNSTFSGNSATGAGSNGGAIYNGPNIGMSTGGILTITNSAFSGNSAYQGGGIFADSSSVVTITNSTFSANSANTTTGNAVGGGIVALSGSILTITNSVFSGNSATSGGGGISSLSTLTVTNSTFSTNSVGAGGAGGGISNGGGSATIANSTFSGNSASYGGGIYNDSTLTITNSTLSANTVSAGGHGGGIFSPASPATLRNTIVAHSAAGGNCYGAITNGGNNLDDGKTCGWGSLSGSMSSTNPLLGALAGSPAYYPLNAGSPAIDKGNDAVCAVAPVNNTSQNGVTRPQGAHCDIGSFEAIPTYILNLKSSGMQDGWVLESSEKSNKGGMLNATAPTFNLGDDASRKQYRGILSFKTGTGIPATAVITAITLKLKKSAVVGGGNPVSMFKGFMLDIKTGEFGKGALQAGDFQAAASQTVGPFKPALVSSWYTIDLTSAGRAINRLSTNGGLTQIRLRFMLDDNNNAVANYLSLFSGNAALASRPQLIITYHVP